MSESANNNDPLSLSLAQRVDQICDRFEDAWLAGQPPRIEDYLGEVPELEHSALLHELLRLELDYRSRKAERPTLEEYVQRFPEHVELIGSVFSHQVPAPDTGVDLQRT